MDERSGIPPPRPVRRSPPAREGARERRLRPYAIAGVLVAGVGAAMIIGVLVAAQRGTSAVDVRAALRAAGCTLRSVAADDPEEHLTTLGVEVEHNTSPPTNGRHYQWWAPWGFYREPVSQLQLVHNLEHGGIVIQYGEDVPAEDVAGLAGFYFEDRNAIVVAPLPALGGRIALGAWTGPDAPEGGDGDFGLGRLALCRRYDDAAFTAFRETYRYLGPERLDPALLEPGT